MKRCGHGNAEQAAKKMRIDKELERQIAIEEEINNEQKERDVEILDDQFAFTAINDYCHKKFNGKLSQRQIRLIFKATDCGVTGFATACYYFDKTSLENIEYMIERATLPFTMLTLAVIATKYVEDNVYANKTVSSHFADMNCKRLNSLENWAFWMLNHDAYISPDKLEVYQKAMGM